jgi:hypothetical protein
MRKRGGVNTHCPDSHALDLRMVVDVNMVVGAIGNTYQYISNGCAIKERNLCSLCKDLRKARNWPTPTPGRSISTRRADVLRPVLDF